MKVGRARGLKDHYTIKMMSQTVLKEETEDHDGQMIKEESLSNDSWEAASAALSGSSCNNSSCIPYRAVTVLTNLQRGNVQTEESVLVPQQMSWHTRAAMGEISAQDLLQAAQQGYGGLECEDSAGLTALCWSASYGQLSTVRLLIHHGSNIEHEGEDGQTALQLSCHSGHHDVTKLLLQSGAQPDHADHMGCTPLMYAAAANQSNCVCELLEHNAAIAATNVSGASAYAIAARHSSRQAIAVLDRYLLRLLDT